MFCIHTLKKMFKLLAFDYEPYTHLITDVTADAIVLSDGEFVLQPASNIWYLPDAQDLVDRSVSTLTLAQLQELSKHEQQRLEETLEVPTFTLNPQRLKNSGRWSIESIDEKSRAIVLTNDKDSERITVTWMDFWCRIPEYQREQILIRMNTSAPAAVKTTMDKLRKEPQWRHNKPQEAFAFAQKLSHAEESTLQDDPWLYLVSEGESDRFVEILKERRRLKREREYAEYDCNAATTAIDVAAVFPKKLHTMRDRVSPFNYYY